MNTNTRLCNGQWRPSIIYDGIGGQMVELGRSTTGRVRDLCYYISVYC